MPNRLDSLCGAGSFRQGAEVITGAYGRHAKRLGRVTGACPFPGLATFEANDAAHFANFFRRRVAGPIQSCRTTTLTAAIPAVARDSVSTAVTGGEDGLNHGASFKIETTGQKKSPCRASVARRGLHSLVESFPSRELSCRYMPLSIVTTVSNVNSFFAENFGIRCNAQFRVCFRHRRHPRVHSRWLAPQPRLEIGSLLPTLN